MKHQKFNKNWPKNKLHNFKVLWINFHLKLCNNFTIKENLEKSNIYIFWILKNKSKDKKNKRSSLKIYKPFKELPIKSIEIINWLSKNFLEALKMIDEK